MTVIEMRTMETICHNLPEIAKQLKRIADSLEVVACIPRFAHVAPPDELERNGWNLNIPRYVDTFEEEAPIDFAAVQADIAKIKGEVAAAEAELDKYLKELGLA